MSVGGDPDQFARFPGPVFRLFAEGEPLTPLNEAAQSLALEESDRERLAVAASSALRDSAADVSTVRLMENAGSASPVARRLDFTILPEPHGSALLAGLDLSEEEALRYALTESRRLYKDIADLVADFAWETDVEGRFSFISKRGAFGYASQDLVGRDPAEFLMLPQAVSLRLPFGTLKPVRNVDVWLRDPAGRARCIAVSALPVTDDAGEVVGARGLGLDVTQERTRQADLAQATNREDLVRYVLDLARSEETHEEMLATAAKTLARGCGADACQLLAVEEETWSPVAVYGEPPGAEAGVSAALSLPGDGAVSAVDGGALGAVTVYRGMPNGAIVLWRHALEPDWSEDAVSLLEAVEAPLGLTLRQIADQRALHRMARTDDLTQLLNRRAFMAELDRALMRAERTAARGALMYVDLDNFKPINDTFGHEAGDKILKRVAELLRGHSREYDLVARLGGDEFGLWLDGADAEAAQRRARDLLSAFEGLKEHGADPARPFGVSIGIAIHRSDGHESLHCLLNAADAAMYRAKKAGKNTFQVEEAAGA